MRLAPSVYCTLSTDELRTLAASLLATAEKLDRIPQLQASHRYAARVAKRVLDRREGIEE